MVSPVGPNPWICFMLPYLEAIPAASINRVGCIILILKFQVRMYKNIVTQALRKPLFKSRGLSLDVLRLDKIHRHISGNKWYKLKYHTTEALKQGKAGIV